MARHSTSEHSLPPVRSHSSGVEARLVTRALARLDVLALGAAAGVVTGSAVFLATSWLLLKGGPVVGPTLALLAQYFPGYRVTWPGSLVGFLYGALAGFSCGAALALLRNWILDLFVARARRRSEREAERRLLDYV
ncbi:MAG: hypothetical protein ABR599_03120 [Gemmatimonadota bacterium]